MEAPTATHSNIQVVQDYLALAAQQNFAAAAALFTPDVRYHVPGHNQTSGDFTGPDAVLASFGKLMQLSGGTYRILETTDWLTSEHRVLLVAREQAQRQGQLFEWTRLILFEIRDGKMAAADIFEDDQYAVDAFWA